MLGIHVSTSYVAGSSSHLPEPNRVTKISLKNYGYPNTTPAISPARKADICDRDLFAHHKHGQTCGCATLLYNKRKEGSASAIWLSVQLTVLQSRYVALCKICLQFYLPLGFLQGDPIKLFTTGVWSDV